MRPFVHVHVGRGVQDALARSLPFAVVLLHVANAGVLADPEAVDTVVLGLLVARVMDAAACDDGDIGVVADMKIVIDHVGQSRFGDDDGNMNGFVLRARGDSDFDALLVRERVDGDVRARMALDQLAVLADIESASRHAVQIGNLLEQFLVKSGKICHDVSPYRIASSSWKSR